MVATDLPMISQSPRIVKKCEAILHQCFILYYLTGQEWRKAINVEIELSFFVMTVPLISWGASEDSSIFKESVI